MDRKREKGFLKCTNAWSQSLLGTVWDLYDCCCCCFCRIWDGEQQVQEKEMAALKNHHPAFSLLSLFGGWG